MPFHGGISAMERQLLARILIWWTVPARHRHHFRHPAPSASQSERLLVADGLCVRGGCSQVPTAIIFWQWEKSVRWRRTATAGPAVATAGPAVAVFPPS